MIKEEKICSVCKILKPKEAFSVDKIKNKLSSKCNKCKSERKVAKEKFIRESRVFCIIDMKAKDAPVYPQLPKSIETERKCKKCELTKSLENFERIYHGEKLYKHTCKLCLSSTKTLRKRLDKEKAHKERRISMYAISEIKSVFKRLHPDVDYSFISVEWYENILKEQNHCCAICKKEAKSFSKRLAVDHCHSTGKVRGLLCSNCNTAIGSLRDDVKILKSAIEYIENPPHYKFEE